MRLKFLLISSPIRPKEPPYNIPLGIAQLASIIDSEGHQVAIFDNSAYKLSPDETLSEIIEESWDIIGIGGLVTTYAWQKKMFHKLKQEFPNTVLVAGGGLASSLKEKLLEWVPEIDLLCVGEGEKTIVQIINNFDEKSWENVRGVFYRRNGEIHSTKPQEILTEEELSEIPFPMYDLLPLDEIYFKYSSIPLSPEAMASKRRLSIEASRGCPFRCSFCINLPTGTPRNTSYSKSLYVNAISDSKKIRFYSPERTVELIKHLRIKYAVDFLTFTDENFTAKRKEVMRFCDLMEQEGLTDLDPPLRFGTTAHVNTLDRELLERLKQVGCSYLDLGLESMNSRILKEDITKGSTCERNRWGFEECLRAGIYPITNFMVGLPSEDTQSIYDTTKFLVENEIECAPFFVTPYPGTGLFYRCKDQILNEFGNLEDFVIKCGDDVSLDLVVNLTKYNDAELLGMRQMMVNHDLEQIVKFAKQKGEIIKEEGD